ncbi:DUF3759 domain-containing protein [Streptomyces sp. NPDC054995]
MELFAVDSYEARLYDEYESSSKRMVNCDLLAGAAAYEAGKAYGSYVESNGQPADLAKAQVIFDVSAGTFIDQQFEENDFSSVDRHTAKVTARKLGAEALSSHF